MYSAVVQGTQLSSHYLTYLHTYVHYTATAAAAGAEHSHLVSLSLLLAASRPTSTIPGHYSATDWHTSHTTKLLFICPVHCSWNIPLHAADLAMCGVRAS